MHVISTKTALAALLLSVAGASTGGLQAQDGPTLIRQGIRAFEEDFDTPRAIQLLRRGVNPAAGPQDSLWAAGVQLLAQFLFDEGENAESSSWARWAMRIMPDMQLDRINLVSDVIQSFEAARAAAAAAPGDAVTTTSWDWPAGDLTGTTGRIRVRSNTVPSDLQVLAVGRGVVPATSGMSLPTGRYEFRASAPGYTEATVTREILPSVATSLIFDLQPVAIAATAPDSVLPNDVESAVRAQLVRLTVERFGTSPSCATGFMAGANGLVLTTYSAIRGGDNLRARLASGRTISSGIAVAAYDVDDNVAVIKLPVTLSDSLTLADDVSSGDFAFALAYAGCGTTAQSRVTMVTAGGDEIELRDSLTAGVQGGPIIDQSGAVVGLTVSGNNAIAIDQANSTLGDARRNVSTNATVAVGAVARQENHIFGTAQLSSAVQGAAVTITPLEDHHWPELARSGSLPMTFAGPLGDYSAEVTSQGQVVTTERFTINPGTDVRVPLGVVVVAGADPGAAARTPGEGGGGIPLPLILVGVAGAAAGAFLVLGGGGDGGNGTNGNGGPGGIRIFLPNP